MSDTVYVRLKEGYGKYMVLTTPRLSLIIKEGGENDPAGFELDKGLFELYSEYFEKIRRPSKKSEKKLEEIDLEE